MLQFPTETHRPTQSGAGDDVVTQADATLIGITQFELAFVPLAPVAESDKNSPCGLMWEPFLSLKLAQDS